MRFHMQLVCVALLAVSFQNFGFAADGNDSSQCQVRVVANDIVVSDHERLEAAYYVLPQGIVENPGQWPYFAWSDTPLGVARTRDGSGYLFFGSDGGFHPFDGSLTKRAGSITVSTGTLDHPLGLPAGDPNPLPSEFLLPKTAGLDAMNYVGGGPVYRVPEGEPGAGNLLIVYHAERPAAPFWSWLGLASSMDEGATWQDLGLIISAPRPYSAQGAFEIGDGSLVVTTDPTTMQKYFYIYFPGGCSVNNVPCDDFTYLSVARAPYDELLAKAFLNNSAAGLFHKYYNGKWNQPGMEGKASELFPAVTGQTDGDPQVAWSAYRNRFVAIMDNGQYIAYGESVDGLNWPPMQVILGKSPETPVYNYANAVGLGIDPGILGDTFYSYYTEWPKGVSWQPSTIKRLTITTAASLKTIIPSSTTVGGSDFVLTVNGDHFARTSSVIWNGSPRPTTYVSSTQLTAQILASDIAVAGDMNVEVLNPPPCGGTSNAEPFIIDSSMKP
ncbi:MAG TPA: IPT/TIG domain-containing protein [Terriglobales bacterium]|nr:IPT/TIG domain-containing protein [Terriglobales bacterium]